MRLGLHPVDRADPEPKALACYGLWLPARERTLLRFVNGRPISPVTCAFLAWAAEQLAAEDVRVLALIWDNASWHISREVQDWVRRHNREVKRTGHGCRLLICRLPSRSPWLNPIEPKWVHGKRAVVEPARKLTAAELKQRLCEHYQCQLLHRSHNSSLDHALGPGRATACTEGRPVSRHGCKEKERRSPSQKRPDTVGEVARLNGSRMARGRWAHARRHKM